GDAWPGIRDTIMGADILILSTPIWLGHASSIAEVHALPRVRRANDVPARLIRAASNARTRY
ncbi:hypothetical protein ACFVZI_48270, partial [Streptomyces mirabilis]